jgi:hypothetical protein
LVSHKKAAKAAKIVVVFAETQMFAPSPIHMPFQVLT